MKIGLVYGVERHFQQYFSNIMTVSFIGEGNQSTWRKPLTCRKLLKKLSHNVVSSTSRLNGIRTHNFSGDWH
jgi:hypothetical protein